MVFGFRVRNVFCMVSYLRSEVGIVCCFVWVVFGVVDVELANLSVVRHVNSTLVLDQGLFVLSLGYLGSSGDIFQYFQHYFSVLCIVVY